MCFACVALCGSATLFAWIHVLEIIIKIIKHQWTFHVSFLGWLYNVESHGGTRIMVVELGFSMETVGLLSKRGYPLLGECERVWTSLNDISLFGCCHSITLRMYKEVVLKISTICFHLFAEAMTTLNKLWTQCQNQITVKGSIKWNLPLSFRASSASPA